jgi:LPS O-antigen subunit length determinant protein (WzzB/FepE family)
LSGKLVKLRADHDREKSLQEQTINDLEVKLAGVRPTKIFLTPTRSIDPVGVARTTIVALYTLLGLMVGVFAAFLTEFMVQTRTQHRPHSGNGAQPEQQSEPEVETVMWESR